MPMRMHSSLSATMDLGLLLYSNPLENVLVYLTVGTLLMSLLTTLAPNHVNPAPTHKYCTNNLCCECVYHRLVFIGDSPLSISLYLSLSS